MESFDIERPAKVRRRVSHKRRERLNGTCTPVLITTRVCLGIWNLRSQRMFDVIKVALTIAAERLGTRIIHFSVQGNHLHFLIECATNKSLSRSMQGLVIRLAKAINARMGRHGKVFEDRFHSSVVHSRRSAYRVIKYVTKNYHKHQLEIGKLVPKDFVDPFSSLGNAVPLPLPQAILLAPFPSFPS